jgi:metallo-beta-lactamase family protein
MILHFHGAARTTTGSMHILERDGKRVLLDCGLYQGRRKEAFERNRDLDIDPGLIDACVLSHAHIDHSGNLPTLVKRGYRGPIYATPATRDLCEIMLADSAHIQEKDVEYVNKKRRRQGKKLFEPLYVRADADAALQRFRTVPYGKPVEVAPGLTLTFRDAGHILGSALCAFDARANGGTRRLLFTGDMGRRNMPILKDPEVVRDVDFLLTESTYGNRTHPASEDVKEELAGVCRHVAARGSRLVIPAFSVGRTQQLLYFLHVLWRERKLPDVPVYVDSPLSTKATEVHARHPECFDRDAVALFRSGGEPFSFGPVRYVADVEESKQLNRMRGPVIIISASGMCEAGRILHHLKNTVEDRDSVVLIVGYQAENTLGRRLVHRMDPIRIFGEEYRLRAQVRSIQALSAHADRDEMLDYFREMGPAVERAFVVHGEPEQSESFAGALRDIGARNVVVPERGQSVEF